MNAMGRVAVLGAGSRCDRDVLGSGLPGDTKGVVAIPTGRPEGTSVGDDPRATVIARRLAEMTFLGAATGVDAHTFFGLTSVGDPALACSGDQSRNRRVGLELGRGRSIAEIMDDMDQVAEGVVIARPGSERHSVA